MTIPTTEPPPNLDESSSLMDSNDPLFDSQSEESDPAYFNSMFVNSSRQQLTHSPSTYTVSLGREGFARLTAEDFGNEIKPIIEKFASSNDASAALAEIKQMDSFSLHDLLIVKFIRFSLDRSTAVQEQTASFITLLSDSHFVSRPQLMRAFEKCIQASLDWSLDVPDATDKILAFFECAVDDGLVSDNFIRVLPEQFLRALSPKLLERAPWLAEQADILRAFKEKAQEACQEYLTSGDLVEFSTFVAKSVPEESRPAFASEMVRSESRALLKSQSPIAVEAATPPLAPEPAGCYRHEIVRILLRMSLGMRNRHREFVSKGLSDLYGTERYQISPQDIQLGVARLLANVEDIAIDVPYAFEFLSKFIVRMIVDDILPPSFIRDFLRLHFGGRGGIDVLRRARRWAYEFGQHRVLTDRFLKIWIDTDDVANDEVLHFKCLIRDIMFSFFDTEDLELCMSRLHRLSMSPDQEIECLRKAMQFAMERGTSVFHLAMSLLLALVQEQEVDPDSVPRAFKQLKKKAADLKIDIPKLEEHVTTFFIPESEKSGLLPELFTWDSAE